jgi:hypothetical protein
MTLFVYATLHHVRIHLHTKYAGTWSIDKKKCSTVDKIVSTDRGHFETSISGIIILI